MMSPLSSVHIPVVDLYKGITDEQIMKITIPCGITLGGAGADVVEISGKWTNLEPHNSWRQRHLEQGCCCTFGCSFGPFYGCCTFGLSLGVFSPLLMLVVSLNVKGIGCPQK